MPLPSPKARLERVPLSGALRLLPVHTCSRWATGSRTGLGGTPPHPKPALQQDGSPRRPRSPNHERAHCLKAVTVARTRARRLRPGDDMLYLERCSEFTELSGEEVGVPLQRSPRTSAAPPLNSG
ncbi:hypothetical protein AAFF_G00294760 [Aldrovandia affinis]|uniref:Uncharacterized protein n=1 Tax=Aldrovandia affinis TaxID=143900 RepID=A0AAD7R9H9_9TELE|nr:hypothetical protein AAFF_G00294760 [Aldrovandia affinis]